MAQAIQAYRSVSASKELKELERLRSRARHNEASALANAEHRGELRGEHRRSIKFAQRLKAKGTSVEEIAELTDLTIDDILRL